MWGAFNECPVISNSRSRSSQRLLTMGALRLTNAYHPYGSQGPLVFQMNHNSAPQNRRILLVRHDGP